MLEKIAYSIMMIAIALVMTNNANTEETNTPPPDNGSNNLYCYSCRGNASLCEVRNIKIKCPANPRDYKPEKLAQFRCMLTYNGLDETVYQGCASKCTPDETANYKRVCSATSLGNCIGLQCTQNGGGSDPPIISNARVPSQATSTLALLVATAVVGIFHR